MNNADKAAYPLDESFNSLGHNVGLTKREVFALAAMQGLLVSGTMDSVTAAFNAVDCADELLKALEADK